MSQREYIARGLGVKDTMARIETKQDEVNNHLKLPDAFTDRDKILLWFRLKDSNELIAYHKFGALYAAKKFIDLIIGDYETKWLGPNKLLVHEWIVISSDPKSDPTLEDIVEHDYSKKEKDWKLNVPHVEYARVIQAHHWGRHPDVNTHIRAAAGKARLTDEELIAAAPPLAKEELTERIKPHKSHSDFKRAKPDKKQRKERGEKAPRAKDGMVTLAQICTELKIDPREARAALRDAGTKKPDVGWAWPSKTDAPDIAKIHKKWSAK